jgi:hypothetical protein
MRGVATLLPLILGLLVACSSDAGPGPSSETAEVTSATEVTPDIGTPLGAGSSLDASGLPAGAVGPLIVYPTGVQDPRAAAITGPSTDIVVFDVGAAVELIRIRIDRSARPPQASFLVDNYIVVNDGDSLYRYALDGSHEPLLMASEGTTRLGPGTPRRVVRRPCDHVSMSESARSGLVQPSRWAPTAQCLLVV